MSRGVFITFEGTEGSGKTTQSKLLAEKLKDCGTEVLWTREPGGTDVGDAIRDILLSDRYISIDPHTEALLHTGSRAEHVAKVIGPALQRGTNVVCDRFYDSTLAYQGGGANLDLVGLKDMQEFAVQGFKPDLTLLIAIDVEKGLVRRLSHNKKQQEKPGKQDNSRQMSMFSVSTGPNRIDSAEYSFHLRVDAMYKELAEDDIGRWVVIDGDKPIDRVFADVSSVIAERYPDLLNPLPF
jgi:dTMP kinase